MDGSSTMAFTGCPVAFQQIGSRCYFYGTFKLNWFRAMEFCHSFGRSVSLAAIETAEENDHIREWLTAHGKRHVHVQAVKKLMSLPCARVFRSQVTTCVVLT